MPVTFSPFALLSSALWLRESGVRGGRILRPGLPVRRRGIVRKGRSLRAGSSLARPGGARRPASVLLRGLLGLADDPDFFEGGCDLLVPAVQAGVGDFDRTHHQGLAAAIGDELPGVEEGEVDTSDEQPYDDYARRVEPRHAAHEGSRGR